MCVVVPLELFLRLLLLEESLGSETTVIYVEFRVYETNITTF